MYAELYLLSGQHFSDPRCRQHIGGHGQRHVRAGAGRHRDSGHRQANPAGFSGCGGERARNLSCRVSPAAWSRIQRRCKLMTHTSRSRIGRVVDLVGCTPGRLAPALRTGPEVWASCWVPDGQARYSWWPLARVPPGSGEPSAGAAAAAASAASRSATQKSCASCRVIRLRWVGDRRPKNAVGRSWSYAQSEHSSRTGHTRGMP
jgi:hypothetical protein